MTVAAETTTLPGPDPETGLRLVGVRAASSLGVARYCDRLAGALAPLGADYRPADAPIGGRATHFHVANSSRRAVAQALVAHEFAVTLHDVRPRTRALDPLYRTIVYPRVIDRSDVTVVHSSVAADLLRRLGGRPRRLEVIPHAAAHPDCVDRAEARAVLRLPGDRLVAVLPGVVKTAKLVRQAVAACSSVADDWLLVLAGPVRDRVAAREAISAGAVVIERPEALLYERTIVAADVVLCLRNGSVGETNGPLLDALGAGRAVLATATGSIPEVAGDAALYVDPTAESIASGLRSLHRSAERRELESRARARATLFSWAASAATHVELFREISVADPLLTVVVATHARPDELERCLDALTKLEDPVEILVVDSASQPPCRVVVERFAERVPLPRLRYCHEPEPGLSRARNRGIAEASCDLVAFVDDDACVTLDWARRIARAFADPRVGCAGGTCRARFAGPPPRWLSERLLQFAGITRIGTTAREVRSSADYPFGANVCFRKDALLEIGGFAEALGRKGPSLLSGEEAEAITRLRENGWRIWLQPDAIVDHAVAVERCQSRYYWRRLWWQGVSRARQERSVRLAVRLAAAAPVRLALWATTRDRVHLYRVAESAGYLFDAAIPRGART